MSGPEEMSKKHSFYYNYYFIVMIVIIKARVCNARGAKGLLRSIPRSSV